MYKDSIKLIEMPEHDSISLCVYCEKDDLFALGNRINEKYEEAYMNGYNWDALISYYVGKKDPDLMSEIETDPEAGMFAAYMSYSPENVNKMKSFEVHVQDLLSSEKELMAFIEANHQKVEWD